MTDLTNEYDDFKEFLVDKLNDGSNCSNDPMMESYSTLGRLRQKPGIEAVPSIQANSNGANAISLYWTVPSDYETNPENYLGFFVLRNNGEVAPTMYLDPNTPDAKVAYIGRSNILGDPFTTNPNDGNKSNLYENTSGMLEADLGAITTLYYSYSVFAIHSDFTYSSAASITVAPKTTKHESVFSDNFASATIVGDTIKSGANTYTMTNSSLISLADGIGGKSQGAVRLQGSNKNGSKIVSQNIEFSDLTPNTIYQLAFYTRSSFYSEDMKNHLDDNFDSSVKAFSGRMTISATDPNLFQRAQLLLQEDLPVGSTCGTDNEKQIAARKPFYSADSEHTFSYVGTANNGIWTKHGITFITGDIKDSEEKNLYGTNPTGNPTQKGGTVSNSGVIVSFALDKIDADTFGTNVSSVTADIGIITLSKGINTGWSQYYKVTKKKPLNLLTNPNFTFDVNSSAVAPTTPTGFPAGAKVTTAADGWGLLVGGGYTYLVDPANPTRNYYATMQQTIVDCKLQQDVWYMSINPKENYVLSFDVMMEGSPLDLTLNLLDITKTPVGAFEEGDPLIPGVLILDASTFTEGKWMTKSVTYSVDQRISPSIQFFLYRSGTKTGSYRITNVSFAPEDASKGIGADGIGIPYPIPTRPSVISGSDPSSYTDLWDFSEKPNSGETILDWLWKLNRPTQGNLSDTSINVGGLYCLNQKGSFYENLSVVNDTDKLNGQQVLCIKAKSNANPTGKPGPSGACVLSSEYYASGVFDLWVRVASVTLDNKPVNGNDPVGCCFADWVFHYIDYNGTYDPHLLLQPDSKRNAEIDIEIGANCPKDPGKGVDKVYTYDVGRLNTWGGVQSGTGANLEMHSKMPNDSSGNPISFSDGEYHKLTFVLNGGSPIGLPTDRDKTRTPGYIKWYIDDQLWGGGWIGADYGIDNIPFTGMRFVFGPWFPDSWAGSTTDGNGAFIWDEAEFYLQKASYSPLYSNGKSDQSNYLVPPFTVGGKPATEVGANPTRDTFLPASAPYMHFDPRCTPAQSALASLLDSDLGYGSDSGYGDSGYGGNGDNGYGGDGDTGKSCTICDKLYNFAMKIIRYFCG